MQAVYTRSMEKTRLLIADFELDSAEYFAGVMQARGYEIIIAASSVEAWNKALMMRPQLALIDMMNTDQAGIELCRQFRSSVLFKDMLIYLFTYHHEDYLRFDGIHELFNGILPKPFSIDFLLSQIKSDRHNSITGLRKDNKIESGGLIIDIEGYSVKSENRSIELARREFELLLYLAGEPGRCFTRQEIALHMWGDRNLKNDRVLDVYIAKLRSKLGHQHIITRKGVGYAFS